MILMPPPILVELNAKFRALSTVDYMQCLKMVHRFPEVTAPALAEDSSVYRDDPEAWIEGTDFGIQDVCSKCSSTHPSLSITARSLYQTRNPGASTSTKCIGMTFPKSLESAKLM